MLRGEDGRPCDNVRLCVCKERKRRWEIGEQGESACDKKRQTTLNKKGEGVVNHRMKRRKSVNYEELFI